MKKQAFRKNRGEYLCDLKVGKDFLDKISQTESNNHRREKVNTLDFIKIRKTCSKAFIMKTKMQTIDLEKLFDSYWYPGYVKNSYRPKERQPDGKTLEKTGHKK